MINKKYSYINNEMYALVTNPKCLVEAPANGKQLTLEQTVALSIFENRYMEPYMLSKKLKHLRCYLHRAFIEYLYNNTCKDELNDVMNRLSEDMFGDISNYTITISKLQFNQSKIYNPVYTVAIIKGEINSYYIIDVIEKEQPGIQDNPTSNPDSAKVGLQLNNNTLGLIIRLM